MNSEWWRKLLDINSIPIDSANAVFAWERPLPAWLLLALIFGAGFYAVWSYTGLSGRRPVRGALASIRFAIIMTLVFILAGPMLVVPREIVERDWVVMLVDRSQSISIADVPSSAALADAAIAANTTTNPSSPPSSSASRITRDQQLSASIAAARNALTDIARDHNIAWVGFDVGAFDLEVDDFGSPTLSAPDGPRSAVGPAFEQALRRLAARPISAIVILSDGRATASAAPSRALVRRLQADAIPVIAVPLGSLDPPIDWSIARIEAPTRAFSHDRVPVEVSLERRGPAPTPDSPAPPTAGASIILIDEATGTILDRRRIEPDQLAAVDSSTITLTAPPGHPGESTWTVRILPDEPDLLDANNDKPFTIELVDRPLHVLYVEGYPRWEYRWLKDLLVRESTVDVSAFLVSADRDFAQEGDTPITRLPASPEELDPYDVMIIGDVHGGYFSPRQLEMIRDHVADRGAGILWLAGQRANPSTFASTPLAGLVPLRGSLVIPPVGVEVTMQPTDLARRLGILQIVFAGADAWTFLSDPAYGWNTFRWALRLDENLLKPTAEPIAVTAQTFGDDHLPLPLVVHMRYGAGRSILVATDEIWRWRHVDGDTLPEQFWIQIIRMLGRDRLTASAGEGRSALLSVSPRRVAVGQAAQIELHVTDAALLESIADRPVSVEMADASGAAGVIQIALAPLRDSPGRFAATIIPDAAASWIIRPADAALANLAVAVAGLDVFSPNDELQQPEVDHQLLEQLADETRGRVLDPADLSQLPSLLPNRTVRTSADLTETLWDSPLALAILLVLLTLEWVGRRLIRLI